MGKSILVISTSLRKNSNSDKLADAFLRGARDAGHTVEKISLNGKTIQFCKGCLACQSREDGHCVLNDDADDIIQHMRCADVLVFATPIYYYEMSGQMKTLLDRANPLYPVDYAFRSVYLLATAAEEEPSAVDGAVRGLEGWISCFEQCSLAGVLRGVGVNDAGSIQDRPELLDAAYEMGAAVK